jgi:hypothetical protein
MKIKKRFLAVSVLSVFFVFFMGTSEVASASKKAPVSNPVAEVVMGPHGINWQPNVDYDRLFLSIARPDGTVYRKTFEVGSTPYFDLSSTFGQNFPDGSYTYELRVIPIGVDGGKANPLQRALTQTGYFIIQEGRIVIGTAPGDNLARALCLCQEVDRDLVVEGSLCAGHDCQYTGDCEVETLRLKESDIRIRFQDTSTTQGDPTNDWQIVINDADSSGSGEYFSIQDVDGSTKPFTIEAGAPDNSIYVDDDGNVGIGTSTPTYPLEMKYTGPYAIFAIERTDGATAKITAGSHGVQFGSITNHKVHLMIYNDTKAMTIDTDGDVGIGLETPSYPLHMASGAYCSSGGQWTNASSKEYKENITSLTATEAMETLNGLSPVKYNYKVDKKEKHVGFISEEVPNLVATKDRKGMSSMDVVAVLTKVVQEQQKTISELKEEITELKKKVK